MSDTEPPPNRCSNAAPPPSHRLSPQPHDPSPLHPDWDSGRSRRQPGRLPSPRGQAGSATIWAIAMVLLASSATACALVWIGAVTARHSAERAADQAALAAAGGAVRGLVQNGELGTASACSQAAAAARTAGAAIGSCSCDVLDCTVAVRTSLPAQWLFGRILSGVDAVTATARAGPVGDGPVASRGETEKTSQLARLGELDAVDQLRPAIPHRRASAQRRELHSTLPRAADAHRQQPRGGQQRP